MIEFADILIPGGRENYVSIKFVVQNLKSCLNGIQKIKKQLKSTLVFHGEKMEDLWLVPQIQGQELQQPIMIQVYIKKQIIFESDIFFKKQFEYQFQQFQFQFKLAYYK